MTPFKRCGLYFLALLVFQLHLLLLIMHMLQNANMGYHANGWSDIWGFIWGALGPAILVTWAQKDGQR